MLGIAPLALATPQVLFSGSRFSPSTLVVNYHPLIRPAGTWNTSDGLTISNDKFMASTTGNLKNIRVVLDTAPGSGTNYVFTVRLNAADTALACTISDAATSCTNSTDTVSIIGGDVLTFSSTPSGSPATVFVKWTLVFDGTTAQEGIFSGYGGGAGTITKYSFPDGPSLLSIEDENHQLMPLNGTLKNLYVRTHCDVINPWVFTLRVNGVSTALTCTLTSFTCSNTTDSISVVAGDLISLEVDPDAGCSARRSHGMTFV